MQENKTPVGLKEGYYIMVIKWVNGIANIFKHPTQSETGYTTQRDAELEMQRLQQAGDKTLNNPSYSFNIMHLYDCK